MKLGSLKTYKGCFLSAEIKQTLADKFSLKEVEKNPDIVVVYGGDGSLISAIKKYGSHPYYLLIRKLSLGYLGSFSEDEFNFLTPEKDLNATFLNTYKLEENLIFNEVFMLGASSLVFYEVFVDNTLLTRFYGTGLIVSASQGSSGINKSFGGPILDPEIDACVLTKVGPIINNKYETETNSICFRFGDEILIKTNKKVSVSIDGNEVSTQLLKITHSEKVKLIASEDFIKRYLRCFGKGK